MPGHDDGALMRQHRSRIAQIPAASFHQRDEALDHFVEQRRFFQIEPVAGLREKCQARGRKRLLQEQTRFNAGGVLAVSMKDASGVDDDGLAGHGFRAAR